MEYEFHVGDYVETNGGSKGYISDTKIPWWKCTFSGADKFNEGFIYNIIGAGRGDVERFYNRIGQYDFTDCDVRDIEPLLIEKTVSMYCGDGKTNSPSDYRRVARQDEFNDKVMKKINELVDAVNELRMRDAKESKDD